MSKSPLYALNKLQMMFFDFSTKMSEIPLVACVSMKI